MFKIVSALFPSSFHISRDSLNFGVSTLQLCLVALLVAAANANPASLYYQSAQPLLAKYAPAPLAPAATAHAAHVAAALSPAIAYAAPAPALAYAAPAQYANYAYASPYAYADAAYAYTF